MNTDLFTNLESLYAELPSVSCAACGQCCVSPTCTLVEFLYLIHTSQKLLSPEEFEKAILSPAQLHPEYEGNTRCAFLKDNRCIIHPGRTGACRLFGIPSLNYLEIPDMVACKNKITATGRSDKAFINEWLDKLLGLNRPLHPINEEPFFLTGLNIDCWLDIYFEEEHRQDFFASIQKAMKQYIDLSPLATHYKQKTNISDKVMKIAAFHDFIDVVGAPTLTGVLNSILNDFPLTGTWYRAEALRYLKTIEEAVGPAGSDKQS